MKKIKITGEVFAKGYEGAFLREISEDGKELATGIWDKWYQANAYDEEENYYAIYWKPGEYDDVVDSEICLDENGAFMVIDEDGKNVLGKVEIEFN